MIKASSNLQDLRQKISQGEGGTVLAFLGAICSCIQNGDPA